MLHTVCLRTFLLLPRYLVRLQQNQSLSSRLSCFEGLSCSCLGSSAMTKEASPIYTCKRCGHVWAKRNRKNPRPPGTCPTVNQHYGMCQKVANQICFKC